MQEQLSPILFLYGLVSPCLAGSTVRMASKASLNNGQHPATRSTEINVRRETPRPFTKSTLSTIRLFETHFVDYVDLVLVVPLRSG